MNIERLEMMRVMLERVVAGSWEPTKQVTSLIEEMEYSSDIDPNFKISRVDLDSWVDAIDRNAKGNLCGFKACAVGHACFDEQFRELGLIWNGYSPQYSGLRHWEAVRKFFEFKSVTTESVLFSISRYEPSDYQEYKDFPDNVREAKMVADRVQALIELGEEEFNRKYA